MLVALASFRLTRLVTTDELTEPFRHWVLVRFPPRVGTIEDQFGRPKPGTSRLVPSIPVAFINCAWCVSVWTSLGLLIAAHFAGLFPSWELLAFAWLAVGAVVGLITEFAG